MFGLLEEKFVGGPQGRKFMRIFYWHFAFLECVFSSENAERLKRLGALKIQEKPVSSRLSRDCVM
ncbi:hypothetical protein [Oscillospiraceae bacterium]|nr:hypothetical protein [Oscillospiraceae bacterium]